MADTAGDVIEGVCRCGATRFTVTGRPLMTAACHCRGCQKMTGGAYSLSSLYPIDRFELVQGSPVLGGLRQETRHNFCPECMSWLYTIPAGLDDFINIRSPMLDTPVVREPYAEFYRDEALPGAASGAVKSFAMVPDNEGFMILMQEFSELPA